ARAVVRFFIQRIMIRYPENGFLTRVDRLPADGVGAIDGQPRTADLFIIHSHRIDRYAFGQILRQYLELTGRAFFINVGIEFEPYPSESIGTVIDVIDDGDA